MEQTIRKDLENSILEVVGSIKEMLLPPTDTSTKISKSKWTVGDAAAHLVIGQGLFMDIINGKKSPYGDGKNDIFAEVNDRYLKNFKDRNGPSLAKQLEKATEKFLNSASIYPDDRLLKTHFGKMELLHGLRYSLCHLLMHGSDIAIALNRPVPVIPSYVKLIIPFFLKGMSERYDKKTAQELNLKVDFNIRNISRFAVICNKGIIKVNNNIPKSVDCHILVDPITFFLVSTGVINIWKPLFKGKILIWGRKPWVALQIKTLFPNP